MLADIISDIQGSGMFSLESILAIAIEFLALLLIIPVINAAIASQPNKRIDKLELAQSQIKLLEDELQASHQKYLELEQKNTAT